MKTKTAFFHCGEQLKKTLQKEIAEVEKAVDCVKWGPSFQYQGTDSASEHQAEYNKAFAAQFAALGWGPQPLLR